uniref:Uncharacterized protein n=1 Tax=Amphimedon queenslandica TaxID=400682 RepID=A0A1X7SR92_AMPQE
MIYKVTTAEDSMGSALDRQCCGGFVEVFQYFTFLSLKGKVSWMLMILLLSRLLNLVLSCVLVCWNSYSSQVTESGLFHF